MSYGFHISPHYIIKATVTAIDAWHGLLQSLTSVGSGKAKTNY